MKRWLSFLAAVLIYFLIHEGLHAAAAACYGEFDYLALRPLGLEVVYKTAVTERVGSHWALISGLSSAATLILGYGLLGLSGRAARSNSPVIRAGSYYLTMVLLLFDPINLGLGAFLYGGDANGIAFGLGVSRYLIQAASLLILVINRELVVRVLLPSFSVTTSHPLFQPMNYPGKEVI